MVTIPISLFSAYRILRAQLSSFILSSPFLADHTGTVSTSITVSELLCIAHVCHRDALHLMRESPKGLFWIIASLFLASAEVNPWIHERHILSLQHQQKVVWSHPWPSCFPIVESPYGSIFFSLGGLRVLEGSLAPCVHGWGRCSDPRAV